MNDRSRSQDSFTRPQRITSIPKHVIEEKLKKKEFAVYLHDHLLVHPHRTSKWIAEIHRQWSNDMSHVRVHVLDPQNHLWHRLVSQYQSTMMNFVSAIRSVVAVYLGNN